MDKLGTKIIIFLSSLILVMIVLIIFNIGGINWEVHEIISCIILNLWVFFLLPSLKRYAIKNKYMETEEWVKMGFEIGIGCFLPIIIAPYYGILYYLNK